MVVLPSLFHVKLLTVTCMQSHPHKHCPSVENKVQVFLSATQEVCGKQFYFICFQCFFKKNRQASQIECSLSWITHYKCCLLPKVSVGGGKACCSLVRDKRGKLPKKQGWVQSPKEQVFFPLLIITLVRFLNSLGSLFSLCKGG